jgi:hypothetical protein
MEAPKIQDIMDLIQQSRAETQENLSRFRLDFQLHFKKTAETIEDRWNKGIDKIDERVANLEARSSKTSSRSRKISTGGTDLFKSPTVSTPTTPISISQAPVTPAVRTTPTSISWLPSSPVVAP